MEDGFVLVSKRKSFRNKARLHKSISDHGLFNQIKEEETLDEAQIQLLVDRTVAKLNQMLLQIERELASNLISSVLEPFMKSLETSNEVIEFKQLMPAYINIIVFGIGNFVYDDNCAFQLATALWLKKWAPLSFELGEETKESYNFVSIHVQEPQLTRVSKVLAGNFFFPFLPPIILQIIEI